MAAEAGPSPVDIPADAESSSGGEEDGPAIAGTAGSEGAAAAGAGQAVAAKKKKKNKKKKKKGAAGAASATPGVPMVQTSPPTVPVRNLYATRAAIPHGEEHEYIGPNAARSTSEEKRLLERTQCDDWIHDMRIGAEVHRQVRKNAQAHIRPGMLLSDIALLCEDTARLLIGESGLEAGLAFPCGTSLNHCAAHFTANPGDQTKLSSGDVLKVDFGVHIKGRIIDCAWTWCDDPAKQPLLDAVRAATNAGIAAAGIDALLPEVGAAIQEVMESYEVEIGGRTYPVLAVKNLYGHSIEPYKIHAGKSVPVWSHGPQVRMEEGEVFAIETFGSTGRGKVVEDLDCSHYMREFDERNVVLRTASAKRLLAHINQHFGTLAFCRRWLDRTGQDKHLMALKALVECGAVNAYPPLCDSKGSYVAQFEHTVILKPTGKEVVTRGDDY